ncbi:DUF4442 domain-containing protein [Nocardia pseudobrasiliensis]|uniref:Uncharacterized protein DUF4442 n=1 Tax=Nocardia pseudobrasiliensis TaxID=45979 RepID=A0A370I6M3_9NOCA|nr:DUF4442 domain-containing protein [Nocardia pseudobrasiliensis]RDI66372.1 uncharacterized protein DUF4442 [Nocardia pseudobrasiliensis]
MNVAPPLLFLGVRVDRFADDWTSAHVSLEVRRWNSNHNVAAPGWSLFAMTDPFFGMMAYGRLGPGYRVWNTTAAMQFLAPGRGTVHCTMLMPLATTEEIRRTTNSGGKSITTHEAQILDSTGNLVARATQDLYVRKSTPH